MACEPGESAPNFDDPSTERSLKSAIAQTAAGGHGNFMAKKSTKKAKAPPVDEAATQIRLRIFDGRREPVSGSRKYLVRILDGNQKQQHTRTLKGPEQVFAVPSFDNSGDQYMVLVSADGCADTGFYPVMVKAGTQVTVDLMLVEKPPVFDFDEAKWNLVQQDWPAAASALAYGAGPADARQRYDSLLGKPRVAAALWNILTAMRDVHLPQQTPLDYLREIVWDDAGAPAQDRFFAFAHDAIVQQVVMAAAQGTFVPEPNPGMFHKDATRSFKQVAFGEANLQLTFHEKTTKKVNGETWVKIEPDIDCYRDLLGHALLEVMPHSISGGKTDPVTVYVLRWIAGRRAGVPEFNPPYRLGTA